MKKCSAIGILLLFSSPWISASQQRGALTVSLRNGVSLEFVRIPAGQFTMGCSRGDNDCAEDEKPAHLVRISRPFEIGKYEVTAAQWQAVMVTTPATTFPGDGDDHAVGFVGWDTVQDFVKRLNDRKDGYSYRLPTEAEWEYAARANTTGPSYLPTLSTIAWFGQNVEGRPEAVGKKQPNAWGLYDMQGNAWEWTQDFYDAKYFSRSPETDPKGPTSGQYRVLRGGSSFSAAKNLRISVRHFVGATARTDYYGFRVVREANP